MGAWPASEKGQTREGPDSRVGETAGIGSPKGAGTDYESEKGEEPNSKKEARFYSG